MRISTFFTWFWILYIPFCILFYDQVNDYVDEVMTLLLALFTLTKLNKQRSPKAQKEIVLYVVLVALYFVYSESLRINTINALLLDIQQQVRPYVVFYCTYLLAPMFTRSQKSMMIAVISASVLLYVILNFIGFSVSTYGLQTPVIGQASLMLAMLFLFCYGDRGENRWVALLIVAVGLLSGKSKVYGEVIAFIGIFFFLKNKLNIKSAKSVLQLVALAVIIIFFTWTKFNAYYVEGLSKDEVGQMNARPASYTVAGDIILKDYIPFGSGFASFATNAAAVHYSPLYYKYKLDEVWGLSPDNPMFLADAYYPTLAQFGLVGIFFFLWFWVRRYKEVASKKERVYYKIGLMCILALALESTADSSYLSGKGMGYFMLLAMCIRAGEKDIKKRRRIVIVNRDVVRKEHASISNVDENTGH